MRILFQNLRLAAVAYAVIFMTCSAPAATVYFVGTNGVSASVNWSDVLNWYAIGGTVETTPANNAANINFNTVVASSNLTSLNVDGAYNSPGSGLAQAWGIYFTHTNGFQNVMVQPGITWALQAVGGGTGNGNFEIAPQNTNSGSTGTGNSPSILYTNFTTFKGINGTLFVNCATFRVEAQSSVVTNHYTILDMSGLGTFIYTNTAAAGQNFYVAANGSTRSHAIVYLAQTNIITLTSAFQVGNLATTSSNSQPIGIYLGQSNYITTGTGANSMLIGGVGAANVFFKFNPANVGGPAMPSAYITAAGGNQSAVICSASGGSVPGSAVCDLTGGNVTWIGNTLSLGVAGTGPSTSSANGTLTFDNGTVTFNTITVGNQSVSAGAQGVGTINIGTNATLVAVNKITLGATTGTVNGSTAGTINITNGTLQASTITNGGAGSTINMTNANWVVALSSTSATNIVVSSFNARGTTNIININSITPLLGSALPVRFHLISAASLNGASTLGVVFPASYNPSYTYGGFLDYTTTPGLVDLVLTSAPPSARILAWGGLNSGTPDGDWDVASTPDWLTNSVATIYNQYDFATFGDIASPAQTNINLTTTLTPFNISVSNNASLYTFGGGGNLSGATGLLKQGNGTLVIDNSGSQNNFTGGVTNSGGILQIGTNDTGGNLPAVPIVNNAILAFDRTDNINIGNVISGSGTVVAAGGGTVQLSGANTFTGSVLATNNTTLQGGVINSFGASNGAVIIASGSTLDANGVGTLKPITVAGVGVSTNGAIISSSGLIGDSSGGLTPTLTLSGDTTLSFPNRWDLGSSTGATLSTGGHAYNLMLNGTGANTYFEWRDVHSDAALANIDITNGALGIAGSTTVGNSAASLIIESSAGLKFYNDDGFNVSINKQVVLKDSGFIQNGAGATTMNGGLVITNANGGQYCDFIIGGTSLTVAGTVTGNGILYMESDTGQLIISGNASAFTGGAQIYAGTFTVNNTFGSSIATQGGTSLSGTGTVNGLVDVSGSFYPGAINGVGTFNAAAGLTLEPSASVTMDLGTTTNAGGAANDLVAVTGNLTANGNTVYINPISGILAGGTYELMTYTGILSNSFGTVQTVSPSRYGLTLSNAPHQVLLTVVGNPNNLVWNNNANDSQWNVLGSLDWTNLTTHAEDQFYASDSVTFDDTISTAAFPATNINIAQTVIPSVVTNNSSANSYTFGGGGKISGGASIVKLGTSTLTIKTTNDFTGNITVAGGTLKGGANGSLGATNGAIYVTNGATLDIDFTLNNKPLVLSGNGVGGLGALVNNDSSGTAIFSSSPGLLNVTLTGNTTIGGANRTDFGQNSTLGAVLNTGGNNYNLTILGNTYRQWDNVACDANFGNITVSQGTLGIVGATTLGNATNTLAVATNAILEFFIDNGNLINVTFNKNLQLSNTATIENGGGTNVILSPIVLGAVNGDVCTNNIGGATLTISNVISGPGTMVKLGSSPLILVGTNTYTGSTLVTAGTIGLTNNGSIAGSTNINLAAGTILDASGRGDKTLTLNSGQTLDGTGTVRGSLTASSGSIVVPGVSGIGTLTVTNVATLQGTTAMGIGTGSNNLLSANSISYGGTLSLSFTPGSLVATNTFHLFSASSYSGSFTSITPASPGPGLDWDTAQLPVNGTLAIISSSPPQIGKIAVSGTSLTIMGSGGTPNGTYHVWGSTNVATPLSDWSVVGSGSFDSSGNFTNTGTINPAVPHSFYLIVEP